MKRPDSSARQRLSIPIGRLLGIPIRIHLSFFLLVLLVLIIAPASGTNAAVALGWLVILFACVVAHELSHSVTARHFGVAVREIDLLPIGGVSQMERIPDNPREELLIAVAGPMASFGVAAISGVVGLATSSSLWPPHLGLFITANEFLWINVLLGAFNLLPAFPLDGGRIFRAWLERRYDRGQATRIAAHTGRVLAVIMGIIGFFLDLWLVLIAVFVYMGSRAEEVATLIHLGLGTRRVRDVMITDVALVGAATPVEVVAGWLTTTAQREFPVVDDQGHYVGLLPADRAVRIGGLAGEVALPLEPVAPDDLLEEVVMSGDASTRAVVSAGRVVGLLRQEDVMRLVQATTAGAAAGERWPVG